MDLAAIQIEIQRLSFDERLKLIDFLWDSISIPESKNRESLWAVESECRIDAFDVGKLETRDSKEVLAELRDSLKK